MTIIEYQGYLIAVGRNFSENVKLLKSSKPNDIWLHLLNSPSPHVIITKRDEIIPLNIITRGAELCKEYSKLYGYSRVKVMYTERKNVRNITNDGSVDVKKFKTIIV